MYVLCQQGCCRRCGSLYSRLHPAQELQYVFGRHTLNLAHDLEYIISTHSHLKMFDDRASSSSPSVTSFLGSLHPPKMD